MITEDEYKDYQKWWNSIKKKPNKISSSDKIELPNEAHPYIKIPNEYNGTFPGVLYRKHKQAGSLKLYGKTKDGKLKVLEYHELIDINRSCKDRRVKEYSYNKDDWFIDDDYDDYYRGDDDTIIQKVNKTLDNVQGINSIKDSSTIDTSQIANTSEDEVLERIFKHPRLESYIDSRLKQYFDNTIKPYFDSMLKQNFDNTIKPYIDSIINTFKKQLSSIPKKLFGMDRVVLREQMLCAWKNILTSREHDNQNKYIYYIPIEVFSDQNFRFDTEHLKDPTLSLKNAKKYAVCQICHDKEEDDNKFFNSRARAGVCAICKNRHTSNKRVGTKLPICVNCSNSSNTGALDKDWDKGLLKKTFEVVVQQFPDLNIEIYAEYVIPSPKDLGQGNHNKRIDLLIVFNTMKTVRGATKKGKVAILIELDDQQKSNINAEETINDIKNTIKKKVKYVNKNITPDILTIWKVNYNTNFYSPTKLVDEFSYYDRMVILRQYLYVMIYHWFELPKQFVLYFWYNYSKIDDITNHWTQNDDERKYISFVWYAPDDPNHSWHYCVDPCEGGCEFYERIPSQSTSNTEELEVSEITEASQVKITQQPNPDKNPYNTIIVDNRKTLNTIFNFDFPVKDNNNFTFSIFD
jgi:hypothetical protein